MLRNNPACNAAIVNLAIIYDIEGRHDKTIKLWDQAIRNVPEDVLSHYFRALSLLHHKRFTEGWEEYKWRFHRINHSNLDRYLKAIPYWNGEDVAGKLVLVWTEQGPGDEILISSMFKDLEDRGCKLLICATNKLCPVFMASFPNAYFITREDVLRGWRPSPKEIAYQASITELGKVFRPDVKSFEGHNKGWLLTGRDRVVELREKILKDTGGTKLIGISWRSRAALAGPEKSMNVQQFRDIYLSDVDDNTALVNLQYDNPQTTGEYSEMYNEHGIDMFNDMLGACHLVEAMDEVRSVSNTTVHIAGGLGVRTTCILPQGLGRHWYWGIEGDTTPWYDSVKLVRRFR